MFEERKNLLNNMAKKEMHHSLKRSYVEQVKATLIHIERIRAMLLSETPERRDE